MDVAIGAGDVHVAAEDELPAAPVDARHVVLECGQERDLGGVVFPAVRDVDRREHEVADDGLDDAGLVVELGMAEGGLLGEAGLGEVEADPRVAAGAVPVAPIAAEVAERLGNLLGLRLDLLKADDVGPLARHPLDRLRLAGANTVHVPGSDLHRALVIPRSPPRAPWR
jgi:hypothetical protein